MKKRKRKPSMLDCSTCSPAQQPIIINGAGGLHLQCARCGKRARGWADIDAAIEDWNGYQQHDVPANCGNLIKALMAWE